MRFLLQFLLLVHPMLLLHVYVHAEPDSLGTYIEIPMYLMIRLNQYVSYDTYQPKFKFLILLDH